MSSKIAEHIEEKLVQHIKDQVHRSSNVSRSSEEKFYASLSPMEIEIAESRLGFAIPNLLKLIYTEVGNGGFGPGHGIFGLTGGFLGGYRSQDAVEQYLEYCLHKEDATSTHWDHDNLEWFWAKGLLPICDWGCEITSSVHCALPDAPVIRHDPNFDLKNIRHKLNENQMFNDNEFFYGATWIEAQTLAEWFQAWVEGKDVFRNAKNSG